MAKKRKRKLKKLAKVLGAGLAIAGLGRAFANRKRNASIANNEAKEAGFDIPLVKETPEENTFKVQDVKVNVPSQEPVANNIVRNVPRTTNMGRMEGKGPESGLIGQKKRSDYVQRAKDAAAAKNMRAFRSDEAYGGTGISDANFYKMDPYTDYYRYMSKGGRVKKRTGAAKRGFGRAFKGGK